MCTQSWVPTCSPRAPPWRTRPQAVAGSDVFLGLSAGNLLTPDMLLTMARDPLVFACANPVPEVGARHPRPPQSDSQPVRQTDRRAGRAMA